MKPYKLILRILKLFKTPNKQTVIDTFLGSGTTRKVAYSLGMEFVGFELDTDFYNMQEKRYCDFVASYKPNFNDTPDAKPLPKKRHKQKKIF